MTAYLSTKLQCWKHHGCLSIHLMHFTISEFSFLWEWAIILLLIESLSTIILSSVFSFECIIALVCSTIFSSIEHISSAWFNVKSLICGRSRYFFTILPVNLDYIHLVWVPELQVPAWIFNSLINSWRICPCSLKNWEIYFFQTWDKMWA